MAEVNAGVDGLHAYLTGGASNDDPTLSLGGAISTLTRARQLGMGWLVSSPIPGVRIDYVFGACGEGEATLTASAADETLTFAAPGDTAGAAVEIAEGESKIIPSGTAGKAVRVYREPGLRFSGVATLTLLHAMNGLLGMADLTSAQRAAGRTTYRCLALKASGSYPVASVRVWLPVVGGAQAVWSIASETPSAGVVQTIASETTAPTSVSFSTPTSESTALRLSPIGPGDWRALWLRRAWPAAGVMTARDEVQIAIKYSGA